MSKPAALISTAVLAFAGPSWGQTDRIDHFVGQQMQAAHIPGVSIGVFGDGKPLVAKGYGVANVESGAQATADTVYELLSITKQFTATAVLMLVEDGKIGLDDPVAIHLPIVPHLGAM